MAELINNNSAIMRLLDPIQELPQAQGWDRAAARMPELLMNSGNR